MICSASPAYGRLNAFQRLMLQWNELHPYNAVHAYTLAGHVQLGRLRAAIRQTCEHCGLGIAEIAPDGATYHHEVDESPELDVLPGGPDPQGRLAEHIARELNRPFARPRCKPLRFSVIDAGPQAHHLCLTYDHWVADSSAARIVARHVLGRYWDLSIPENDLPPQLYPGTYREVFADRLSCGRLLRAAGRSLTRWWRKDKVARAPYSSSALMSMDYRLYPIRSGTAQRLRAFARSHGATVHDVILAALGRAMAESLPPRAVRSGRHLALGTIADTRADASEDLGESLGVFLGCYTANIACDPLLDLAEATRRVAAQTGPIKAQRGHLDSLVNMKLACTIWPRLPQKARRCFIQDSLPLTAGVSNILVRDHWLDRGCEGRMLDYSRAASTGPIAPLVLTPTTFGSQMNVGVTYRVTGFTREKIDRIMERFLDQIQQPEPTTNRRARPIKSRTSEKCKT